MSAVLTLYCVFVLCVCMYYIFHTEIRLMLFGFYCVVVLHLVFLGTFDVVCLSLCCVTVLHLLYWGAIDVVCLYCVTVLYLVNMSPLCTQRWRHAGLPLSAQCVCRVLSICPVVSVCQAVCIVQAEAAPANTRRLPNAGLMLVHHLRRWANISSVLG